MASLGRLRKVSARLAWPIVGVFALGLVGCDGGKISAEQDPITAGDGDGDSRSLDASALHDANNPDDDDDASSNSGDTGPSHPSHDGAVADGPDASAPITRYTELVNPLIGTGGNRNLNCFPGAVLPWGMVSASPDTTSEAGVNSASHAAGYLSEDPLIQGFSHTRLQGTSTPDVGVVMLMPAVGPLASLITEPGYRSLYDKESEQAEPGYYAVTLQRPNVRAELTATRRGAHHRYTFQGAPPEGMGRVVLDLGHAMVNTPIVAAELTVNGALVEGYTTPSGRFSGPSKGGLRTYFSIRFDPAPTSISTWSGASLDGSPSRSGTKVGAVLSFAAQAGTQVEARVGISYVDVQGARNNRETELAALDFAATRQKASDAWQRELASVQFEGGSEAQRTIMATALYHSFVVPSLVSDVDGRYHGYDNQVHSANFAYHANFSMWDTYRTVHPLLSLVRRDQQRNLTRSLIQMAREGGYYPRWAMGHGYPNITAGSPADIVVAESYLRGVDGFDADEALDLMLKEVDNPPPKGHPHSGREGLADYLSRGYIPVGLQVPGVAPRVVVRSLEYNIADGAIANMAHVLGRTEDEQRARAWSKTFATVWDPGLAVFRGRNPDGSWFGAADEFSNHGDVYYGANAIQYAWLAPHDPFGLMALHGSRDTYIARLTRFFDEAKKQLDAGQSSRFYTHNDEPDVHAMYLFLVGGRPDLTQRWVEWASRQFYGTGRDGLSGNEDAGTLSAWYVLSAIGLYPVTSTDIWLIGRPAFPRTTLAVAGGALVIEAPDASPERPYVRSVTLNGEPVAHPWLKHEDVARGGTLRFEMSDQPGDWGKDFGSW